MSKNRSGQSKKKRSRNKSSKNRKNRSQLKKNIELAEVKAAEEQTKASSVEAEPTSETSEEPIDTADKDPSKESESTDFCDVKEPEADTTTEEPEADTVAEQPVEDKPAEEPETDTVVEQPVEDKQAEEHEEIETKEPEIKQHADTPEIKQYAEPPVKKTVSKKHRTGLKVLAVMIMLIVYSSAFISGAFAVEKYVVSPDRFHKGIIINNVDVSGMNVEEAKDALTKEWNKHSITIVDRDGNKLGKISNFDFEYKIDDQLESVMKPGAEKAISRFLSTAEDKVNINMKPAKNTKSFKEQYEALEMVRNSVGDKPSKNAYIDKSDTEFRIVKEVIGNSVDTRMLRKAIFEAIARGEDQFEYRRESFYKPPEIVSTSQVLKDELEYCRKYLSFKIHFRNSVGDYTITPDWLDKMLKVEQGGKTIVYDEAVSQFISDVLYPKFSSTGDTRTLKSAGGGKYTVSGGTYGFTIDTERELDVIRKELEEREDVEREPYYSGKKPNKNGTSDIGNDYVEVSIAKQNVWVVKGGKVVVDTPVVTGNVPRHNTPTGVYYILYKATNTTLKGHNDDGSEYESHVAYWMPFYLGYGLHDASWRGSFGGSIYMGNGSHGCVNCPPPIMPKIFKECYEGMPVIVH